jgi:hypothetical protein
MGVQHGYGILRATVIHLAVQTELVSNCAKWGLDLETVRMEVEKQVAFPPG